jgi:hypothetical protein
MQRRMFVKSMTTFADHRVWQDVYQVPTEDLVLYVKFQADHTNHVESFWKLFRRCHINSVGPLSTVCSGDQAAMATEFH